MQHAYTLDFGPNLKRLDVQACPGPGVTELLAANDDAATVLGKLTNGRATAGDTTRIQRIDTQACVEYSVDLSRLDVRGRRSTSLGKARLLHPDSLLWLPPDQSEIDITVSSSPGMSFSAPWSLRSRSGDTAHYRMPRTPAGWNAAIAVGEFPVETVPFGTGRLRVALLGDTRSAKPGMLTWLENAASSVVEISGEAPLNDVQVLLVPVGPAREAVPFAQVLRGGGSALKFYVDPRRPLGEFLDDWTATHEFAHLLHPFLRMADTWLAEGIASYYQNVLRARTGALSEQTAWRKLLAGFERGRRQTAGFALTDISRRMYRERAFMRVYWSGAAVALLADLELRRLSDGRQSLDTALAGLQDCCLDTQRRWTGTEFAAAIDRITATDVMSRLYAAHAESTAFPDTSAELEFLGVDYAAGGVRLDETAVGAAMRRTIMSNYPRRPKQL